jgi:SCP-2 sterol transfer family protein
MSVQSYVKLRKLTAQDGEPIEDVLQRGVDELRGLGEEATVELRLIGGENAGARSIYSVRLTSAGAVLHTERTKSPTLVLITTAKAFLDMADGSYSPVQACLDGKLKLQGNADLARRIIRHLGELGTEVTVFFGGILPQLFQERYDPRGIGGGSLTVSGNNFTPGPVHIVYTRGGRKIAEACTNADPGGSFPAFSQNGITCGDRVTVTATDSKGLFTAPSYPTPCPR